MIYIQKGTKKEWGGCNGCNRDNFTIVWCIWFIIGNSKYGTQIRLCNDCKKELLEKFKKSK